MPTMQPPPAPEPHPEISAAEETAKEAALIPSPLSIEGRGILAREPKFARVPVEIDIAIPVEEFRVRDLLLLEEGQVIETRWAEGDDLPLAAGKVQLAWCEFEVLDSKLAVRLTKLA
jgi:flagellar motor switch protein FliN